MQYKQTTIEFLADLIQPLLMIQIFNIVDTSEMCKVYTKDLWRVVRNEFEAHTSLIKTQSGVI
jgi:hypothetical protein